MKFLLTLSALLAGTLLTAAPTLYVDNLKGSDANDGSREKPLASIERACKLVKTGGRIEVADTGTPYSLPYGGPGRERGLRLLTGGTADSPLVVEGNGAVVSGLAVIPAEAWSKEADGVYSLPFDPMSNFFRRDMSKNYWLPGTQIWFVDGKPAPNLLDRETLEKTPNGFWWNKKERKVLYRLPEGRQLSDLKIELPANYGFYIHRDHTIVRNFTVMFSWNDGFDAAETPKSAMYLNCLAYNNCGQGMSIHDASSVYYQDCGAVNCASSAVCNVGQSNGVYKRCVLIDSTFEAAVFLNNDSSALFEECLIADAEPAELVWQRGRSKITFSNCVLIGNGKNNLAMLEAGALSFFGCTMRNGTGFLSLEPRSATGSLSVEKSLLRGFARYYVKLPDQPAALRVNLAGNRYAPNAGHWYKGKSEVPGTSPALTALKLDRGSKAEEFRLTGRKSSENPGAPGRRSQRIGAQLPEPVWQIYNRLKNYQATPAGIVKKGAVLK